MSPRDTINGSTPCTVNVPGFAPYRPGNYEGSRGGVMSITDATARSVNCAYARLGAIVGLDKVATMAARLGLPEDRLDPFPSISLGAEEATPLEMAAAYATMANDGVYRPPSFVERVLDRRGRAVFEGPHRARRAVSAQTARVATQVLRSVVERGTGRAASLPGRQVAGKTGTSQDHENAWFVGITPQLATAVWMGSPVGNVSMLNVGGRKVTGGSYPAEIFGRFMADALDGVEPVSFPSPNLRLVRPGRYLRDKNSPDTRRRPSRPASTTEPGRGAPPDAPPGADPPASAPPAAAAPPVGDAPPVTAGAVP